MSVFDWFSGLGQTIHKRLSSLFGENAASMLIAAEQKIFQTAIGSFALQVVTDLAGTDLTSTAKWEAAGTQIAAQAVVLGIQIVKSEINLLIELAYSAVKHKAV